MALNYESYESLRLQGKTIREISELSGRSPTFYARRGYAQRFNSEHANFKKEHHARKRYTPPASLKDADPTLANQVKQAPTRAEKLNLIADYRQALVAEFGQTLMDVPDEEPRLRALQLANRVLNNTK